MLTLTLDTNCLVALEENRPAASGVRALLEQHDAGLAQVRFAATTAAERRRDGEYLPNFGFFQARLKAAGLDHLELVKPVAILGLTYSDWCVVAGDHDHVELRRIHDVLFSSPYDYGQAVPADIDEVDRQKAEHKWRNRRLDGLGLHCHIRSGGDAYVTSDENFVKATKQAPLAALGAKLIFSPEEAAAYGLHT
ncbi:hypothetical protein [Micromonospora sp. NBC_00858]|uniref:hypothetical protein n=1 Tax=Micromonospora sp. NBC_00858 TaxID=2975979 RepID=UPI0038679426|nr:hypothetical protein OG990_24200 [Micromonospora sp. NBC_00858]